MIWLNKVPFLIWFVRLLQAKYWQAGREKNTFSCFILF
jgi:hypothetical protein